MNPENQFNPQPAEPAQPYQPQPQPSYAAPQPNNAQPSYGGPTGYESSPAAAADTSTTADDAAADYTSNPYRATAKGLVKILQVNPVPTLLFAVVLILILVGVIILSTLLSAISTALGVVTVILTFLAILFATLKMVAGSTIINIKSFKGETVNTKQLIGYETNKKLDSLFFSGVISAIAVLVGLIFLIIPGILIAARLSIAPFAIYNENLGAIAALKRSWQLTRGHTIEMLGAMIAQILVTGSGGLLGVVGSQSATATRYFELLEAEKTGRSTGKQHWLNLWSAIFAVLFVVIYVGLIAFTAVKGAEEALSQPANALGEFCYTADATSPQTCTDEAGCQSEEPCAEQYFDSAGQIDAADETIQMN